MGKVNKEMQFGVCIHKQKTKKRKTSLSLLAVYIAGIDYF